ncbi:MAG: 50S ribosomal protein L25, partial [Candidatus Cloacimonetes bacterium]|nr:50S ribosomal protein L25 [Candidatus Cloacimonadota bacterium]
MNINIEAKIRNIGTKSDIKNLRKEGFIPGILYGEGKKGINITLEKIPFLKQYKKTIGETAFFNISIEDKSYIS